MSLIAQYGPHLPFLRRYARALTGSQESGDAYIRACLEALSEDPSLLIEGTSPRAALYRFFHAIWSTTGAKLAPIQRQAFLLTTLEGFSRKEASEILNKSAAEIDQLIDAAHREIEQELSTSVLIIEDEPIIAADLANLVEDLGHTFAGNAATRKHAVELARKVKPGLILCDVQLADNSSGIDAVQDILADFDLPVIFITAFPERLLTGERPEPTYLITKPFQDDTVKAAISQALFFHAQAEPQT